MARAKPSRRAVLTGIATLPAAAAATTPAQARPTATKPDGSSRHDPVMPDTEHTRTYYKLARS